MVSRIYLNESISISQFAGYNKKQNRRVDDLCLNKHGWIMLLEAQ